MRTKEKAINISRRRKERFFIEMIVREVYHLGQYVADESSLQFIAAQRGGRSFRKGGKVGSGRFAASA
jgi:hypothetical protein